MAQIPLNEKFDAIYIDRESLGSDLAQRVFEIFPKEMIQVVDETPLKNLRGPLSPKEFSKSKRRLFVTPFKGHFFKRCPGSRPGLMCCNYYVLNWGLQCDMNCSYCYLQSFINSPLLTLYSNLDQAIEELKTIGKDFSNQKLRVGTGETVDSLSLDELTLYSRKLINLFKDYPQWILEFKSKSDRVDQFLDCEHAGNVVVSWSVNPEAVISAEEHLTASLEQRLKAAEKCLKKEFQVAFHMDPMIYHENWQSNYAQLVDEITSRFQPEQVNVISIGALRFQPEQRHMMKERFSKDSWVNQSEVFRSRDGKLRYDSELRTEMYKYVLDRFQKHSKDWKIFLCMETPETWLGAEKSNPHGDEKLKELFKPIKMPTKETQPDLQ
ncbi:MAG TPA: hypothetical protein DCL41_01915 [Bdellovibrionales bacterium]|nr:hypothetical protein [Bdellovibrionales bacterium]